MTAHSLELDLDADGWNIAVCECGWQSPGCPDPSTAAEVWGGHLIEAIEEPLLEIDGWAYCVEHDECVADGEYHYDDVDDAACRAWQYPADDEVPCRFVPVLIRTIEKSCEVQP
jgi:hypothetical protein